MIPGGEVGAWGGVGVVTVGLVGGGVVGGGVGLVSTVTFVTVTWPVSAFWVAVTLITGGVCCGVCVDPAPGGALFCCWPCGPVGAGGAGGAGVVAATAW